MTSKTRKKLRDRKYSHGRHKTLRRRLEPEVAAGMWRCTRGEGCKFAEEVNGVWVGGIIDPGTKWDLGHDEWGGYRGPEHVQCNRATNTCNTSRKW